jgi:ATP-dependent helicase/nuclease subunit B
VVLPGADAQTLGPVPAGPALISDALARLLELPSLAEKRQQLALQFAQLLRVPALTLLRCRSKGSELLSPSPLLERLQLALREARAAALADWIDQRPLAAVAPTAQARATALAPARLPAALSASAIESLRQCPYQFFARSLLGLREAEELQGQLDKRDYGTWLHAVLHQFHRDRADGGGLDDGAQLNRAAEDQQRALGLAPAEFLPYAAGFARFVPRYLDWLAAHEAAGNRFAGGEMDRQVRPFADLPGPLQALSLRGRIDRLDHAGGDPARQLLIDYKTGSLAALKDKVAQPLEDTQLAVYALLMQGEPALDEQQACYLALDDARGVAAVMHEGVAHSALQLLEGLREDLEAVAGGAALPALGEGRACEYCEMRGLCRRDDWTEISL